MARLGRPPVDNPRIKVIPVRLTPDEHAAIVAAAKAAEQLPGVWMRERLVAAAKRGRR